MHRACESSGIMWRRAGAGKCGAVKPSEQSCAQMKYDVVRASICRKHTHTDTHRAHRIGNAVDSMCFVRVYVAWLAMVAGWWLCTNVEWKAI